MWAETKHGLYRQFVFKDFQEAWAFMEKISTIINELNHHPRIQNEWNVVEIWSSTHDAKRRITNKDWELAKSIDKYASEAADAIRVAKHEEKITTKITEVLIYADGGSRGNPGPSASGFVLLDMDGKIIHEQGIYLGITTNNQAEYQALKLGMETAREKFGAEKVHVFMDSLLVVNQMKRIFKVKNRDLWPIHDAIQKLSEEFDEVEYTHVPRELNKLADAQVNAAMDKELHKAA